MSETPETPDAPDTPEPGTDAARIAELETQLAEALAARQRALADFANFQRRAAEAEMQARESGASRVVKSLLGVLDQFEMALEQTPDAMTAEQLAGGIRIVRDELKKVMEGHGLRRIEVEPGDDFDPHLHQAVMRSPSDEFEPNRIVTVLQTGYAIGDMVLRPTKVAVAAERAPESTEGADSDADV